MSPRNLLILTGALLVTHAFAQQPAQPPVKVNVLNVCTPSAEEQKEISSALAHTPKQPLFGQDFEVDRGRSTLSENPGFLQPGEGAHMSSDSGTADWVRIRREFSVQSLFSTVQYSFSADPKSMIETLVFRVRDPKDLMQLSLESTASAVTSPAAMLATSTPVSRIKLERFGKASVVLARCSASENAPAPDQSSYEPLFQNASAILTNYRGLLGARRTVPEELVRVRGIETGKPKRTPKPPAKKPVSENK